MTATRVWQLMAERDAPATAPWLGEMEMDLWPYRDRTVAILKRYARSSVEVGRLPSLLGREFFRSRVTSYSLASFEDIVIFVHDVERALERLDAFQGKLIAMNVLEEYSRRRWRDWWDARCARWSGLCRKRWTSCRGYF